MDLADPECDQVVEDRAGRARLAPDLDDVVDRQAGLDRGLVLGRVDVQIPVEKEVAHDADASAWDSASVMARKRSRSCLAQTGGKGDG